MSSAIQELQQGVCQKYGWSITYDYRIENCCWYVSVGPIHLTTRIEPFVFSFVGGSRKEGKKRVSALALEGLRPFIEKEESKPVKEIIELFSDTTILLYDSSLSDGWDRFWKNPPTAVGIDTEGNQSSPPILIQISTNDYTILEVTTTPQLSSHLQRLLHDDSITKVFCDNSSHRDKKSLGLVLSNNSNTDENLFRTPPIVDLEYIVADMMGTTNVPRGLSKIFNLCMLESYPNVRIGKPLRTSSTTQLSRYERIGRFAMIEQGKSEPLKGFMDLSETERQYAALDSWCTLKSYQQLLHITAQNQESSSTT